MTKEKVFIVASHMHSLKKGSKTEWETTELVEFVNQLKNKHYQMSSAIGDYLNRKMITGSRFGINDYDKFEEYVRTKYKDQMTQLDAAYRPPVATDDNSPALITDEFGNVRLKTVFDHA